MTTHSIHFTESDLVTITTPFGDILLDQHGQELHLRFLDNGNQEVTVTHHKDNNTSSNFIRIKAKQKGPK